MYHGLLRISGTLDLDQFWPKGASDADTAHVTVPADGFAFSADGATDFRPTRVFEGARIGRGRGAREVYRNGRVTLRFEGIDAPELHYTTQVRDGANHEFRQPIGEGATLALGAFLRQFGANPLPVMVETEIDHPGDAFDVYGRLIGRILVIRDGVEPIDVNAWLVEQGWAFPTFYNSMSADDITRLRALARGAEARAGAEPERIWANYAHRVEPIDIDLRYVPGNRADNPAIGQDLGPTVMPKLFRRAAEWTVALDAGLFDGDFEDWLIERHAEDFCVLTRDFLKNGVTASRRRHLSDFVTADGTFLVDPDDLVFVEHPAELVARNGAPIEDWA